MKKIIKFIEKFIFSVLITILLGILVIVIYSFVQLDIQKKEYCNIFGYSIFQIETGSMEDTLQIEDIIIIKLGNENIKENDIITFRQDKNFITHRVKKIDENAIITKGDNNPNEDEPIKKEDILGKVQIIIPEVKIWKSVFKDPKVIVSICVTIALLILTIAYKEKIGEKDVR
jgi:signal peptidase